MTTNVQSEDRTGVNFFGVLLAGSTPEVNDVQIHQVCVQRSRVRIFAIAAKSQLCSWKTTSNAVIDLYASSESCDEP